MSIPQPYDTGLTEEQLAEAFRRALGDMTDEEIENAIATAINLIPKGLVYRGAYKYFSELPSNAELGEVYTVKYKGTSGTEPDGNEYAWGEYEGTLQWIPLGVDAYTKNEIDALHEEIQQDVDANKSDISLTKNDIAINRATLGTQSKNLAKVTLTSRTINGIAVTVNEDKSITFNGTATASQYFEVGSFTPPDIRRYALSGCPDGGSNKTYQIYISAVSAYNAGPLTYDARFTPTNTDRLTVAIMIYKDAVLDNVTFYPMVRDASITDRTYEPYQPSLKEQIDNNINDMLLLVENKMGYDYGCSYAKNESNVGWFKVASFSCPGIGSTIRRATFFVSGWSASSTGLLNVAITSVSGNTPGIGSLGCSWSYNQFTTSGGQYVTNIPTDSFKAIANLDGNMIRVELWCNIKTAYFVLKSRLLNFESRTDFLSIKEVEMYTSSTSVSEEPVGDINTISSYNLRKELDDLKARITALENK